MLPQVEMYICGNKNYFAQYWRHIFQLVETLLVEVMGLLKCLIQETRFEAMQTSLPTSRDSIYFSSNSFSIGRNIFQTVEAT